MDAEIEIEFVNRKVAEAEAARAIGLLNASDGSKVEAWFAMQAVADQIGPESNTGRRGVSWWLAPNGYGRYGLKARCLDGMVDTDSGAPKTQKEALDPKRLDKAEALLARKIAELGGRVRSRRPKGTADALIEAVSVTAEGRAWLAATVTSDKRLLQMVRVADAYGREGVNPKASLSAHHILIKFDDRAELIQECLSTEQARGKAITRNGFGQRDKLTHVPPSRIANLAIRAGVTRTEARIILRALIEGRSKTRLHRAVNEGAKMVEIIAEAREKYTSAA